MKRTMGLTGEASNHKIAGIFDDPDRMRACRDELERTISGLEAIERLEPGHPAPGWSLEPEPRGIWHTLVRAHLWLALAGAAVGLLVFALLWSLGIAFVVGNPWAALLLLLIFPATGGALLGGLVTMRPDHVPYITRVKAALDEGRLVLLVHATSREQLRSARHCLERYGAETVATL